MSFYKTNEMSTKMGVKQESVQGILSNHPEVKTGHVTLRGSTRFVAECNSFDSYLSTQGYDENDDPKVEWED